jgi:hypothetical protein
MPEIRSYTMNFGSGHLAGKPPALNLPTQVSLRRNEPDGSLRTAPVEARNG